VRPDWPPPDAKSSVRQLAAEGGAVLMNEHEFDQLERPDLFGDAMHLNEEGGVRFSRMAAREIARRLAESKR
jgi:hypothetical protein